MATTTVHVILTGIISLIPQQGADGKPGWTVRMDAQAPGHEASLVVEEGAVQKSSTPGEKNTTPNGTALRGWQLDTGTLSFEPQNLSSDVAGGPLSDVLSVADACDPTKPKCAKAKEVSPRPAVAFEVRQGTLQATLLERGSWQFAHTGKPAAYIAEEICWTFEIDQAAPLRVTLRDSTRTVSEFELVPPPNQQTIELRLQNLLPADRFPKLEEDRTEDEHVDLYFDHSEDRPGHPVKLVRVPPDDTTRPVVKNHPAHRLSSEALLTPAPAPTPSPTAPPSRAGRDVALMGPRVNCPPLQWTGAEN